MEGFWLVIAFIAFIIVLNFINWVSETIANSKKYLSSKVIIDNLNRSIHEHDENIKKDRSLLEEETKRRLDEFSQYVGKIKNDLSLEEALLKEKQIRQRQEIQSIAEQKSMGFPWLAQAYADYFSIADEELANFLESKKHPAYSAAEAVRTVAAEKNELRRENKILQFKIRYFLSLFPWLSDLIASDENEDIPVKMQGIEPDNGDDEVRQYLTSEEYGSLSSVERNQKALDRYIRSRHKSKWAIGRDYEMYIGFLYQKRGFIVEYKGIIDGFDDLGRDIIASKGERVCIVQCKYWSQSKKIHEKHIFQLFGTTMEYVISKYDSKDDRMTFEKFSKFVSKKKIIPIFVTSTCLSDRARNMASTLGIEVHENVAMGEYPRIKCNVNHDEFGQQTKIYHLPMDQQYDRTTVNFQTGDFSAFTVQEAEDAGFRRAFRHRY